MADTQTRLASLLEKMAKLEAEKTGLLAEAEAEKAINAIGADLAGYITKQASSHKVEVKVLNGKFFALTVGEDGKLAVALATKATKANGGTKPNGNGGTKPNGNGGDFEYFLANGEGPFPDIQTAMDKLNIPKANRPAHNRYDRLSKSWKDKITQKAKASQPVEGEGEGEGEGEEASQPAKS